MNGLTLKVRKAASIISVAWAATAINSRSTATYPPRVNGGRDMSTAGTRSGIASALHWPAAVVPMGYTYENLPSGLQLIGRPWSEPILIEIAYAYEQATQHRVPRVPSRHSAIHPEAAFHLPEPLRTGLGQCRLWGITARTPRLARVTAKKQTEKVRPP